VECCDCQTWPKTEIKAFVHLCGFYQNHIRAFAEIAAPLTELLKKNEKFEIKEKHINAWKILKEETAKANKLAFSKPELQSCVYTDASDIRIGGVYTQIDESGKERPIRFLSWKLTETERRYDIVSKELLALVSVLQKLRKYLLGRNFNLFIDSNAVKWLVNKREISAKHSKIPYAITRLSL
jgi:hypothetical protein